ncbi:MAG: phosphate-starvation-inducible E-like protein [Gammaproteobacteria bacterium]|nr:phosphate-starvation-inducible E-like protein [Gammaproteobacteria bacterium]
MIEHLRKFERLVVAALILMLALVIMLSLLELGWVLVRDISKPPVFILEIHELLELFGLFLLVLIGIELLETMKRYYNEGRVELDVIISVSLIAIGRKIITMDPKEYNPLTLVGIAAIILALFVGYWVIKRTSHSVPQG